MNPTAFSRVFPFGSHLCREPMPSMAEMKRDMEALRTAGFNLVKLQEHWMVDEPAEGQYDFSRYEELISHAAGLDMGVYLGFTCEQAPGWLWEKHPDCRMVGRNGLPIAHESQSTLPADGKPGPCYDHPGAMADQLRFIAKAVETLGRHENLVVWNTWQEISYWADALVGSHVCYCPHTLAAYRRWLAGRYGTIEALNRAWNSRYPSWEAVRPDRAARLYPCAQEIDWRLFMDNSQIGGILRARAAAIRAADPFKRPVFAHKGAPMIGAAQDWTYARCQDFLGSSTYPAWGAFHPWDDGATRPYERHAALAAETHEGIALRYDYVRSANPPGAPVWAAEFQGGPVSTGFQMGRVPDPADIRRWLLSSIGAGVTAISFWVTRVEIMAAEANGFGLLDTDGETTPRFAEAGRIGRALNRYPDLFGRPTRPRARVAVLVSERNHQFCAAMGQGGDHLSYDVRGWHRLLRTANIPVDFLDLSDPGTLDGYPAAVLPFGLLLSDEDGARLAGYVEQGGTLVCEAGTGRFDANAFCRRGGLSPAIRELLGVRRAGLSMVREPDGGTRWSPPERTWGEYLDPAVLSGAGPLAGASLRAHVYIETYACGPGAEPCLLHGKETAGVVRRSGNGAAWLIGTYVGHGGTAYRSPETADAVRRVLAGAGVAPEHDGDLLLLRRATPEREGWIISNPTPARLTESFDVPGWGTAHDLLDGPVAIAGGRVTVTVEPQDVRVLILERGNP